MSDRINCFEQTGEAVGKIAVKLCKDQTLIRLLVDMSNNPLDESKPAIDTSDFDFTNGRIRTVPNVDFTKVKESTIVIVPTYGVAGENSEFSLVGFDIDIWNPQDKWQLNYPIQRPSYIMSCLKRLLDNSRVTGIGTLRFVSFDLDVLSSEVTMHTMRFVVDVNN